MSKPSPGNLTPEQRIARVESILGHHFANPALALQAVTHPSMVEADPTLSYQRLEFLGDAVIGFSIARLAYERYPDLAEGDLTKMRIAVVNGSSLALEAERLGLAELIEFGTSEPRSGSRGMHSALGDVFEALAAALYLDAGQEAAEAWVIAQLGEHVNPLFAAISANPKTDLQERAQATGRTIEYRITGTHGPAHEPTFTSEVVVGGSTLGTGTGASKRQAEAAAAEDALSRIEAEGGW